MKFLDETSLTYDDVLLVPQYSEVKSRTLVDTSSEVVPGVRLGVPIVSANMDTVTEVEMALAMDRIGGMGILHRFMTIDQQVEQAERFFEDGGKFVAAAIGVKEDCIERADRLIDVGVNILCLDVAHGHTQVVADTMTKLHKKHPDVHIIAGNVATAEGAYFLIRHGASAVKVGVGPGSVCSTRIVAGVGVPQFSAVAECAVACREHGVPLIADGGIREAGDVAKAIAAGASTVMVGGVLSKTVESPGEIIEREGRLYKSYRGMASKGAMARRREVEVKHLNGSSPEPRLEHVTPEGVETLVPYSHQSAEDAIGHLHGGLKSAMSYSNSATIDEFHKKAIFTRITRAGLTESHPHAILGNS